MTNFEAPASLRELLEWEAAAVREMGTEPRGGYYSLFDFVLRNGREFDKSKVDPKHLGRGLPKQCFLNAFNLARKSRGKLIYCEGYLHCFIPLLHAWCVTPEGQLIEPTLAEPASAYFGLPIRLDFVLKCQRESKVFGVLDLPRQHFPILTASPELWKVEV